MILKALVYCLALFSPLVQSSYVNTTLIGTVQIFDSHEIGRLESLILRDNEGAILSDVPLSVRNLSPESQSGDLVSVKVRAKVTSSKRRALLSAYEDVEVLETDTIGASLSRDFIIDGKPIELPSITVVVSSLCDQQNRISVESLQNAWFGNAAGTLEKTFNVCSHGQLLYPASKGVVTSVELPCTGTRPDAYNPNVVHTFDSQNSCSGEEYGAWREITIDMLKARGIDTTIYKRLMIILPHRNVCNWGALGMVGCAPGFLCTSWYQDYSDLITINYALHELMHNTGLLHGNTLSPTGQSIEYGDLTDVMGFAQPTVRGSTFVCLTAPQSWKAGWMSPSYETALDVLTSTVIALPVYGFTRNSFARIIMSPVINQKQLAMFISYRAIGTTFDSGLNHIYDQQVHVHLFNGTTTLPRPDPAGVNPFLVGILTDDYVTVNTYRVSPVASLSYTYMNTTVRFMSKNNTHAIVSICKWSSPENTRNACIDGVDNDCNGLVDADEPACTSILKLPFMPPPPSPFPPSPPPPKRTRRPRKSKPPPKPPKPPSPPPKRKPPSPPPPKKRPPPPSPRRKLSPSLPLLG